jgi:putative tricarboxylic transport membrane protein
VKTGNIVFSIISIVIAACFVIMTFQFKAIEVQDTGPAFLPRIYAGCLVLLSLLLLIKSLKSKEQSQKFTSTRLALLTMLLFTILILLIPFLGFYLITPIVIFFFLKIFNEKNLFVLLGVPIGVVLFVFFIFQKLLFVPIPTGTIFQ